MKVINLKEWRNNTVMWLIESQKIDAEVAVKEAKQLEKYIFQHDLIVGGKNIKKKKLSKIFLKA